MQCAEDITRICPDAIVINYINPTTVNGIALSKYAPHLKSFALCDGLHMPFTKMRYAQRIGIINELDEYTPEIDKDFDMKMGGVNHFSWIYGATYKGKDVLPEIAESIKKESDKFTDGGDKGAKAVNNEAIGYELYQIFGAIPCAVSHTKEYLAYWQGKSVTKGSIPDLALWDAENRYERHREMFRQVDSFIEGKRPISEYMTTYGRDHATDIIENIVGNLGKKFFTNSPNRGAVTNMPNDAFLELLCETNYDGAKPLAFGEIPVGIRGLQMRVLDTHELTADAVVLGSYELLRRAMMTDPLITSITDADAIIKELLEAERDQIPAGWYK